MNQLRVVKSLNNGIEVLHRQHFSSYREVGSVFFMAGPGAPLQGIAKYFGRFGWTVGEDGRSFKKGEVSVKVWDGKSRQATNGVSSDGSNGANIILALSSFATSLQFFAQLEKTYGGKPTLVLEPTEPPPPMEALRTMETERVHGMYRITYSTQDLVRDIGEYIKGKVLDAITPEEVSRFMDARDILNDPLSIIASKIPIHPHTATARGSYVAATKDMGDRTALLGQFLHYRITTIMPHGTAKSFLVKNKTGEIVYAHSTVYVYGNAAQVRSHGPVFNDATLRAIWKENQDIYTKANYVPDYAPEN